jgi:hypothetical protein
MKATFIVLFILFNLPSNLFADATPKFNDRPVLEFWINDTKIQNIDSILIITIIESDTTKKDTLWLTKWRRHVAQNKVTQNHEQVRIDIRTQINEFKIQLLYNNKVYISNWIKYIGARSFFRFNLTQNGEIVENHPLFYVKWIDYFKSLGITLFLEILFAIIFFKQIRRNISISLIAIIVANSISHPVLWYIDSHININIFILELGVFFIESLILILFLRNRLKLKSILKLTLFANWISWWIGAIIYWIII